MGSLDVDSLFTNIPLEETINICCDTLFKETDIYEGYSKSEFKTLLSLASKESYFFFNEVLYKQKDGLAMGLLWVQLWPMPFYHIMKKFDLSDVPRKSNLYFIEGTSMTFVLFESQDKLIKCRDYFNCCHPSMSFSNEVERDGKLRFLDVIVFRGEGQFVTNVYRKPTFSGFYIHFESFFTRNL